MGRAGAGRKEPLLFRWIDGACEGAGYLSGAAIFLATLVICYAVTLRAFGHTTIWQTEFAVYLLILVTFIGGAYGLKHGSHVRVDLLLEALPEKAAAVLQLVGSLLSLVVLAVVLWKSTGMWWQATVQGWGSGTAWNPPLTYPYAALPLGMLLMALQYLVLMARDLRAAFAPRERPAGGADAEETSWDR